MKTKEWIVVFVDKDTIKAEKITAYVVTQAIDNLLLKLGIRYCNVIMVVENSGNGAFCVETVKGLLDCGTVSFDSAEVETGMKTALLDMFKDHYWGSLEENRELIMKHISDVLEMYEFTG